MTQTPGGYDLSVLQTWSYMHIAEVATKLQQLQLAKQR